MCRHVRGERWLTGFKQAVFPRATVSVDTNTALNLGLELGEVSEQVTGTGVTPLLRTDRADVATTFDARQITDLPVLDRNFTKFVLLTPGTQQLGWQHAASENPQGSTQTMVNGQHFSGTTYQLDGTENRDPILGIIVINPTLESIRDEDNTADTTTRSSESTAGVFSADEVGNDDLHASAFEFFQAKSSRRESVHNRSPIADRTDCPRPGGTSSAVIWWPMADVVLLAITRETQQVGGSRLASVPTAAARGGDSALMACIFDRPGLRHRGAVRAIGSLVAALTEGSGARLIPRRAPGRERDDATAASGSETFDGTRSRPHRRTACEVLNTFGATASALHPRRAQFRRGARRRVRQPWRPSDARIRARLGGATRSPRRCSRTSASMFKPRQRCRLIRAPGARGWHSGLNSITTRSGFRILLAARRQQQDGVRLRAERVSAAATAR